MNATAMDKVDDILAHKAQKALTRIIERDATRTQFPKMDREDWREYGEQLFAKRRVTPGNQEYGEWIVSNGLDVGPAQNPGARADAMWLFQSWTILLAEYQGIQNSPTHIRHDCRKAGFAWARTTAFEDKRRNGSRRAEAAARYSWVRVAAEEKVISAKSGGKDSTALKRLIESLQPGIDVKNREHEPLLRAACATILAERKEEQRERHERSEREERERNERAVAKSAPSKLGVREMEKRYQAKHAELQNSFHEAVGIEVHKQLPDAAKREIEEARATAANAQQLEAIWRARMQTCKVGVSLIVSNWRTLAACLHPDRAPEDRHEQFSKAFDIVKRAADALEKANVQSW